MALTAAQAWGASTQRVGVFFRLEITPVARLWLGVGACLAGIDATDGSGATYSGLGEVLDVPRFQQLINGAAERVEFSLSGVSPAVLALAASGSDEVKQAPMLVGVGLFDSTWALIEQPTWIRRYVVDYLAVSVEATEAGIMRAVKLSCRSFMTGRRRPSVSLFSDDDQQTLSPGDLFCERTVLYTATTQKIWPRY